MWHNFGIAVFMNKEKTPPEDEATDPVKIYSEKPDPQAETGVQGDALRVPDAGTIKEAAEKLDQKQEKERKEVVEKNDTSGAAS